MRNILCTTLVCKLLGVSLLLPDSKVAKLPCWAREEDMRIIILLLNNTYC